MVKHIVVWKFKPGTEAEVDRFLDALRGLQGQIDVIRSMEVEKNGNPKEGLTGVLIGVYDSYEDLRAYAEDPRHVAVSALCKSIRESRLCTDFEF